jgi:ABC-type nitrate/sulfonate/bicarbonate transport system ATPase subunit
MLDAHIATKRLPSGETLLHEVALRATPGEIVALLGASGTGKTSTLQILLGLDRAFEGNVRRTAARVGAVFQEPRLLPWHTVGDNIRLVMPRGQPVPDIPALLREVGLAGSEALYPRQISLGMARRAALARALAIAPDLLILDEPFASLDAATAGLIAARLARLRDESGAALVIATHDIDRATALATRIVVLVGRPATVVYQADIPAGANEAIRAELLRRFPFLSDQTGGGGGLPDLPPKG